jgi:hypothetical protein
MTIACVGEKTITFLGETTIVCHGEKTIATAQSGLADEG